MKKNKLTRKDYIHILISTLFGFAVFTAARMMGKGFDVAMLMASVTTAITTSYFRIFGDKKEPDKNNREDGHTDNQNTAEKTSPL